MKISGGKKLTFCFKDVWVFNKKKLLLMQLHIYIWIKTSAHRQYKTCETFISTILYFQHLSINTQGLRKKASQYVILSSVMITPKALPPEKTRPQYVLPCILLCNYSDSETSTHQSSLLQPPHSRLNPVCFRSTWQLICIAVLQKGVRFIYLWVFCYRRCQIWVFSNRKAPEHPGNIERIECTTFSPQLQTVSYFVPFTYIL